MRSTVILVLSASLLPAAVSAQAIEPSAPSAPTADEAGPSPEPAAAFRPFMVHLNLGLNTYTYLGAFTGLAGEVVPEAHLWPGNRLMLLQQLGFGWWVHPNVRLTITLQFAETATNLPSGSSPLTLMGAIPWVTFTHGPFFAGAGPLLAWWAYGAAGLAAGIFLATGFTVPVGSGLGARCRGAGAAPVGPALLVRHHARARRRAPLLRYRRLQQGSPTRSKPTRGVLDPILLDPNPTRGGIRI